VSGRTVYAYVRGNPISLIDPLGLWGAYGFGSLGNSWPPGSVVRGADEVVGLGGYDTNLGFYVGGIAAAGIEAGGTETYGARFYGKERTISTRCGVSESQTIDIREISVGPEIPFVVGEGGGGGYFDTPTETGIFVFWNFSFLGQHVSFGGGFAW
jgi:hypothetical protein